MLAAHRDFHSTGAQKAWCAPRAGHSPRLFAFPQHLTPKARAAAWLAFPGCAVAKMRFYLEDRVLAAAMQAHVWQKPVGYFKCQRMV